MKQMTDYLLLIVLFGVTHFVIWKEGMLTTELAFKWKQDHDKLILLEKRVSEMESKK